MKKITSLVVLLGVVAGGTASAAPSHLTRDANGGYRVTYNYKDKAKTGWYITGRAELSFLNWKNEYDTDYTGAVDSYSSDEYLFEPVFGASIAGGFKLDYFWRAELEAGYVGRFSDSDAGIDFSLSVPYIMANAYYDFVTGFYVGGGLGVAVPTTELDWANFSGGDRKKTSVSPMLGVMLGYAHKLDDNLVLDFRYRLAGFTGTTHERDIEWRPDFISDYRSGYFENKIGLILDNSFSIGLRYEF